MGDGNVKEYRVTAQRLDVDGRRLSGRVRVDNLDGSVLVPAVAGDCVAHDVFSWSVRLGWSAPRSRHEPRTPRCPGQPAAAGADGGGGGQRVAPPELRRRHPDLHAAEP